MLHHYIGEFHMELEEYGRAIESLSKAVKLDPKREWTHFSLGKCYYLTEQYNKAGKAFRANIENTTNRLSHYHSWLFLAMTADALDDTAGCEKALEALERFQEFFGKEIPLEHDFLSKLQCDGRLPQFFSLH